MQTLRGPDSNLQALLTIAQVCLTPLLRPQQHMYVTSLNQLHRAIHPTSSRQCTHTEWLSRDLTPNHLNLE
jgi:hypothetical protein